MLTKFNNQAIAYEGQTYNPSTGGVSGTPVSGNPVSYFNGTRWAMDWAEGRNLVEAETSTDTTDTSLSFAYDASGLRTGKTVTVQTYAETHTVTFVADGETVETLTVEDGYVLQEEDYPAVPEKTGYSGTWTPYTLPVTADITIQASYAPVQHTVTFVADGVTVDTIEVAHGYVLKDSDYPAVPEKPGLYGFWEEYTDPVELDITIQADYQMIQQHTVEFVTSGVLYGQTRVVKSMKVPTGYVLQESDYPEVPPKLGQLGRWKRYTDPIVQDITIYAEYGNPIPGTPTDPPSLMSTGEEPYSSGTAQPISTVTEEHSYIYAGGMLLRETITSGSTTKTLDFRYDNVGYPYALIYNNGSTTATYYYITNLQGDVMYLVDGNGIQVAAYTYDPYGKILSAYGSMAEINPLRYRGYYYDAETGFYYLQSRYYDPNTCRFINADSYTSTGRGLIGYNMFAYCENDPVNYKDAGGLMAGRAITVAICDGSGWLGETYATLELAAKAFLMEYFGYTALLNYEYGAMLYQRTNENGAAQYCHGRAQTIYSSTSVVLGTAVDRELLEAGWSHIGDVHTHPEPGSFSPEDIQGTQSMIEKNTDFVSFVGTAGALLYRYDKNGETFLGSFTYDKKGGRNPVITRKDMMM